MFYDMPASEKDMKMVLYDAQASELQKIRERPVFIHNEFIQGKKYGPGTKNKAQSSMSKEETKIFYYLVAQIKPEDKAADTKLEFNMTEFCKACGIGGNRPSDMYKHLKESIKALADRSDWLQKEDGREQLVRIIADVELDPKNTNKVFLTIHPLMAPYLFKLKKNFTRVPLFEILKMKSKYGMTLISLLRSDLYRGPIIRYGVNEFKAKMDATHFDNISSLKRRVIEPAMKDIENWTSLKVEVRYEKKGRSISHVVFYIRDLFTSEDPADECEYESRSRKILDSYEESDQMTLWSSSSSVEDELEPVFLE